MTIRKKFIYILTSVIIVGITVYSVTINRLSYQKEISLEALENGLLSGIKGQIKYTTDVVSDEIYRRIKPLKSEEDQIKTIREIVKDLRYFENNSGYFFVAKPNGENVAHPIKPEKQGKNFYDAKDAKGERYVEAYCRLAVNGGGFIEYYVTKPGESIPKPKLAYVTMIGSTEFLIGSGAYIDDIEEQVNNTQQTLNKASKTTFMALLIGSIFILCIIFVAVLVIKSMLATLSKTTSFMVAIADGEGDLTVKMDDSRNDELGILSRGFNQFVDKLRNIILDLKIEVSHVDSSSTEMKDTSEGLSSSAEKLEKSSSATASTTQDLSASISELSQSAEIASNDINNVASAVEELNSTISEVSRNCSKESEITSNANQRAQEMKSSVSKLKEASEEINQVVEIISSIAEQTNLLALNATIEAASAGEAGKGFAVVANEVKELAKQSAEATDRIRKQVESIQNSSNETITGIETIADTVVDIDEIANSIAAAVEEQSAATSEISNLTQRVAQSIIEVSNNAEHINVSAKQVSTNVEEIASVSEQTAASATESNASAAELAKVSNRLKSITNQFKVDE